MNKKLDEKLVKDFPLLYGERYGNMRSTAMCWGFCCGDGWHNIIRELSSKLEPLIKNIADQNILKDCYSCGCKDKEHKKMPSGKKLCKKVHEFPYSISVPWCCGIPQWKRDMIQAWTNEWNYKKPSKSKVSNKGRVKRLWVNFKHLLKQDWSYTKHRRLNPVYSQINKVLSILQKIGLYYRKPCPCNDFQIEYPRAAQVKEKYGTLRFYMHTGTDEMYKLIDKAEKRSAKTCEDCGKPGRLRGGGWLKTLCNKCAKKQDKEQTYEEYIKEVQQAEDKQVVTMMSLSLRKKV